jgi:hypothetical protein
MKMKRRSPGHQQRIKAVKAVASTVKKVGKKVGSLLSRKRR